MFFYFVLLGEFFLAGIKICLKRVTARFKLAQSLQNTNLAFRRRYMAKNMKTMDGNTAVTTLPMR
jgi:hypothetical protein